MLYAQPRGTSLRTNIGVIEKEREKKPGRIGTHKLSLTRRELSSTAVLQPRHEKLQVTYNKHKLQHSTKEIYFAKKCQDTKQVQSKRLSFQFLENKKLNSAFVFSPVLPKPANQLRRSFKVSSRSPCPPSPGSPSWWTSPLPAALRPL